MTVLTENASVAAKPPHTARNKTSKFRDVASTLSIGLCLSACTTKLTSTPDIKTASQQAVFGIPYTLPKAEFELTAKWTFTGCKLVEVVTYPKDEKLVQKAWELQFDTVVSKKDILSAGETYVLDYRDMSEAFKLAELKTEYHSGTNVLKSINATIEGKEPEALVEGFKLAAGIAKLAFIGAPGGGSPSKGAPPPTPSVLCSAEGNSLFEALKSARGEIKKVPVETAKLTDEMSILSVRANLGALSDADKKRIEAIQAQTKLLAEQLVGLTADIKALEERLSFSKSWSVDSLKSVDLVPDKAKLQMLYSSLLTQEGRDELDTNLDNHKLSMQASISLPTQATQPECRKTESGKWNDPLCGMISTDKKHGGILYRNPAMGDLKVCRLKPDPKIVGKQICDPEKDLVLNEKVAVPQLGQLRLLSLKSGWGEHNQLEATFDEKGTLTMAHYNRKAAPGLAALKTANEGVTQLTGVLTAAGDYRQKKKDAEDAAQDTAQKAEIDELTHQIDLLTKQQALQKLTDPEAEDPVLKELQARLAILRLQKEERELLEAINKP